MEPRRIKELLINQIAAHTNAAVSPIELLPVGGGSINHTYLVKTGNNRKFFLKLNSVTAFPGLFEKEKNGLEFLAKQNSILIPSIIFYEVNSHYQLLLLEWIENGVKKESFWKKMGEQLAGLHFVNHEHFGFIEDNYMGSLPQSNTFTDDWVDFFISRRLQPQVQLAAYNYLLDKSHIASFETIFKKLNAIFNPEKPSLLHGDLWSGNFMCNEDSLPVLIDPAIYFGHRSIDLAMTTLFGGFDKAFYDSYHYHYPLPSNYAEQWQICNLYPLLIHLNLFGKSYLPEITGTLKKFT